MKKKCIIVIVLLSLILNIVLGFVLYKKVNDKSFYETRFLTEISFAIQRFEEYSEHPSNSEYMVGVAHLYSAYTMFRYIDDTEENEKQSYSFYELWNVAAIYPERCIEKMDDLIRILNLVEMDFNFNDREIIFELDSFNAEIRNTKK
ncbi:MAG TPA: hypothetical protein IAC14_06670 [Candidatus Scybalomonas excrementigallinarum]|nr:hypothetical protein [Candidatus Scybalomonas excrementigallinarum]